MSTGGSLVIGGCGFLGYHVVRHLLQDGNESLQPVHIFDLNTSNNRVDGVASYTQGAVSDGAAVKTLLDKLQPRVVFHMASPPASLPSHRKSKFHATNVVGTATLLSAAAESPSVRAFVYTSTVDVYADPPHNDSTENQPLWTDVYSGEGRRPPKMSEYCYTKTVADGLVRAANSDQLKTVVLRPGHVYGERHTQGLYEMLEAAKGPLVQLGSGKGKKETVLMEVASADNVAAGHVLAAKALLGDSSEGVAGEAFNLSDGSPVPFWHHVRVIWGVAKGKEALDKIWVLPPWLMIGVVFIAEWSFWALSLGTREPPTELTSASLSYCIESHSYSIDKARRLLCFAPVANHDEVLAESVRWELNRRGQPVQG
ncbi:erg26, C-3 sterol dehydrogenase [Sporothrix stenoceras]|uniref:Erg26, C-3 sterol dehydrogenase n=1 Tax=Sporothrix stenoceras TaxID=5173 RepID=A0ABR3YMR1_9PEZI